MAILLSIEPQDITISAIRKLFIMKGCIRNKKEVLLVAFNVWLKKLKVKLSLQGSVKGDSETHLTLTDREGGLTKPPPLVFSTSFFLYGR